MQAGGSVLAWLLFLLCRLFNLRTTKDLEMFRLNADDRPKLLALKAVNKQLIDLVGRSKITEQVPPWLSHQR